MWYGFIVLWVLLLLLLSADGFDASTVVAVLNPLQWDFDDELLVFVGIPTGIIMLVQWSMLVPAARPIRRSGQPRSLWFAAIMAALLATFLIMGVLIALIDLPRLAVALGFTTGDGTRTAETIGSDRSEYIAERVIWIGLVTTLIVWGFWTFVLMRTLKATPAGWLSRTTRWLLLGTVVELVLTLPLYLFVRRRYDCWCALPSLWGVGAGIMALFALTGPGVLLIWRARRGMPTDAWVDHCMACGYQRAVDAGPRCPECGTRWGRVLHAERQSGASAVGEISEDS